MADNSRITQDASNQRDKMNFGKFKVALADLLTFDIILALATFFEFPPAKTDELRNTTESGGQLMVSYMEEKGHIKANDISPLLDGLKARKLHGLIEKVTEMFAATEIVKAKGKTEHFLGFLKSMYQQLYNKVQPIPYIREKVYCVNDVFVESGIEIKGRGGSSDELKLDSHRDVFNDEIISSKRILLEGGPGYGKSMFTLQAAYDWCCGINSLSLRSVGVFILLPLRLLGGISSLYQAIQLYLMPGEANLTEKDIEEILRESSSVLIILDGYDEYPDKENNKTDIMKLIAGTMFANFKVITCTRSSYLPEELDTRTVRVRLTGFNDKARDEYIKRAVVINDKEDATRINDILTNSPVLSDICEVPLFCVMFAHISHEEKGMASFASVTSFFKYMISCFYNHMWQKQGKGVPEGTRSIPTYVQLNKLAFDSLTKRIQRIVWPASEFRKIVGVKCYTELTSIGILIEEQYLEINDKPGTDVAKHIRKMTVVRFYHKLFAEWYAAHHLSLFAGSSFPVMLRHTLQRINPIDLQFVLRFACGINTKAAKRIIKFLKEMEGGNTFAWLCFFEQAGEAGDVAAMLKDLCSGGMTINATDSRLLQRSKLQIMNISSNMKIPVPSFTVDISSLTFQTTGIALVSGVGVPICSSLQKMLIKGRHRQLSEEVVARIANYGQQCHGLRELRFTDCTMPVSIKTCDLLPEMMSWNVPVYWCPSDIDFQLNFQSGHWEVDDIDYVSRLCETEVCLKKNDSRYKQMSTVQLLHIASVKNISISCVTLDKSFDKVENEMILLRCGLKLPALLTVGQIHIVTDETRALTQDDVMKICNYGLRSQKLKDISFGRCILPMTISAMPVADEMMHRNIKLSWRPWDCEFFLNWHSGQWNVDDVDSVRNACSTDVSIHLKKSELAQRSAIQLLNIASDHKIPIPCVTLDQSFHKVDKSGMVLNSGLAVSKLLTVEKLHIETAEKGEPRELPEDDVIELCNFGLESERLKEISFGRCLLPLSFARFPVFREMMSRNVKVSWRRYGYSLNLQTGLWNVDDISILRRLTSQIVRIQKYYSPLLQRCNMQLLENASNRNIPISELYLFGCSPRADTSHQHLIMSSGLSLPILSSLQQLWIHDTKTLNDQEFIAILVYSSQCTKLKVLSFHNKYSLPKSLPVGSIPPSLVSGNVKVYGNGGRLNFRTCRWESLSSSSFKQLDKTSGQIKKTKESS